MSIEDGELRHYLDMHIKYLFVRVRLFLFLQALLSFEYYRKKAT